ncbi:MAG: hypothetical protein K6C11_00865 [Bacilli bacterium]|nr:hypothetical protein [Bacilli bacterium]
MTFVETLPVIINVLLCVLLIVTIILVVKCIIVVDKADKICDNVENKISALDSLFNTIGLIDDKIGELTGFIFSGIEALIAKVFKKGEDKDGKR